MLEPWFNATASMKKYQPLLLQKLAIRVPGLHIRRLALHRHLPETADIRPHAHKFFQCLVYLGGQGQQQIQAAAYPVKSGTAVFLPPRVQHAFHRLATRRPLCLLVDFDWRRAPRRTAQIATLPQSSLLEVRQQLAEISRLQSLAGGSPPLLMSAMILKLLNAILRGLSLAGQHPQVLASVVSHKLEKLLASPDSAGLRLRELARAAGYQHDYLNRLLKSHSGLTMGQLRSRRLLARSQQLLRQPGSVATVASGVGFLDPNYFARWFRKQTGMSPSHWRRVSIAGLNRGGLGSATATV
ncbi:MAG: AraC family transcriptional regulator [Verrucomicrobia bacterium]|nr:MAG: AraC family transcriptional regulator [Verrucomicrobiota bacterium]